MPDSWKTDFITSSQTRWVRLQASIIIYSILTGGGVPLLVERAAGAAEAGDHGEDEDGAGGAHDDPDPHRQTEMWMVLIKCCNRSVHKPRMQGKNTHICHSLLDLRLDDLVLLGAAVLVVLGAATEYVLALVRGRAVEAGVPLAHGILVPGAVLAAQNWKGR